MIFETAETAFRKMSAEYKTLLSYFYPARDSSGFVERNLTYRFCKSFEQEWRLHGNDSCFAWMEYPLEKYKRRPDSRRYSCPHIDSVIFIFSEEFPSVIYLEAKRISENNYNAKYRAIVNDIQRLKKKSNREFILNKEYSYEVNMNNIKEYICFISDVWVGRIKRSYEVPGWWENTLPAKAGLSDQRKMFIDEIKDYSNSSYNILGVIDQL